MKRRYKHLWMGLFSATAGKSPGKKERPSRYAPGDVFRVAVASAAVQPPS